MIRIYNNIMIDQILSKVFQSRSYNSVARLLWSRKCDRAIAPRAPRTTHSRMSDYKGNQGLMAYNTQRKLIDTRFFWTFLNLDKSYSNLPARLMSYLNKEAGI